MIAKPYSCRGLALFLFWFLCDFGCSSPEFRKLFLELVSELLVFVFVTVSFCRKTPGFARRSKGCAGSLSLSMVCLCFCCCLVCLLVGRLVLSFCGVRCFCSCSFCFARVASFESVVCGGGAWGVFFPSFCWCQTRVCLLLKESPAAAPSNQSSCCPVCLVPASFFFVCCACMLVLCLHAPARMAFAAPFTVPVIACSPCLIFSYLYLSFIFLYTLSYLFACKSCSASSCFRPPVATHPSCLYILNSHLLLAKMAEANVDAPVQQRRGVVRNQRLDDQGRNTRQRVDDLETRMDAVEAQGRSHETRLLFLEAHVKVVLRGFTAVQEFLRDLPGDFNLNWPSQHLLLHLWLNSRKRPSLKRPIAWTKQRHCSARIKGW